MNLLRGLANHEDEQLRATVFAEVTSMLNAVLPEANRLQQNEQSLWPVFYQYVPQVLAVLQNSQWPNPPLKLDFAFATMLSNVGTFLWHTGQIKMCDLAMLTALRIIEEQPKVVQDAPQVQSVLSDILLVTGILADCIGVSRREDSLQHRLKLLQLREEELQTKRASAQATVDDEIRWGNAKGDLACAYLQRNDFHKTREIMEELFECYYKRWGTEDEYPYEYSKYYHHLGFVLMAEGKPQEALNFSNKGVQLELTHSGEVDSTVLISRYDLACLKFNAGQISEATSDHQEVLKERIQLCGKGNQFTLESHEAVGILLHLQGRNEEARYVTSSQTWDCIDQ